MNKPFIVPVQLDSICQPPTSTVLLVDRAFRGLARLGVIAILALLAALVFEIGGKAIPLSLIHI